MCHQPLSLISPIEIPLDDEVETELINNHRLSRIMKSNRFLQQIPVIERKWLLVLYESSVYTPGFLFGAALGALDELILC